VLNPIFDPFKSDVYGLGITALEIMILESILFNNY